VLRNAVFKLPASFMKALLYTFNKSRFRTECDVLTIHADAELEIGDPFWSVTPFYAPKRLDSCRSTHRIAESCGKRRLDQRVIFLAR